MEPEEDVDVNDKKSGHDDFELNYMKQWLLIEERVLEKSIHNRIAENIVIKQISGSFSLTTFYKLIKVQQEVYDIKRLLN